MNSEVERRPTAGGSARVAVSENWVEQQLARCEVGVCRVERLLPSRSPRKQGVVDEHVRLLVESESSLPPIIVHRPTMRVIDGMHRLRAAVLRGQSDIEVRWYDGDERDVFAIAVRTNVAHGLPLTHADRRNAAAEIIVSHPHWSDRMIASVVNLASTTVRSIRNGLSSEHAPAARVGLDGRTRPANTAAARRLAGELLRDRPDSSIREIAKSTGLAPSTVLDVRNRLREGLDPVPARQSRGETVPNPSADKGPKASTPTAALLVDHAKALRTLRNDPSLRFNEAGRTLLRWFETVPVDADKRTTVIDRLPSHCIDTIAALASEQAATWQEFAAQLRKRNVSTDRRSFG